MNKKHLRSNLIFTAAILVLAGWLLLWQRSQTAPGARLKAQLTYGNSNTVLDISLEKDILLDVDTGYYTVHIQVENGQVRFVNSPCPDHVCENYGWLALEDQQAVCMPAHAVLAIVPAT